MKKALLSALAISLLAFTSCSTIKRTATTADVQLNVCQYPTVVDIEVTNKVELVKTWSFAPFNWGEPKLHLLKGNLIAESLNANDADLIIDPQFSFTKKSYGQRRLVITGYLAKYKNFRKATPEDLRAIEATHGSNERTVYNDGKGGLFSIIK